MATTTLKSLEKKMDNKFDRMTAKMDAGFESLTNLVEGLAISTKNGFDQVHERLDGIDTRLNKMDDRFDRIENVSIGNQGRKIENLEDDMRVVKTKIGLKKNQN